MPQSSPASMDRSVPRGRWVRWRRWLIPAGLVLAVLAAGFAASWVPQAGTLAVSSSDISVGEVKRAPFQDYLPVRATVAPLHTVYVGAVEGGTVRHVAVQDGASVKPGDVLATLSNPHLRLDVTAKEAAIAGQLGGVTNQRLLLQQNLTSEDNAVAEASYNLLKAERELSIRRGLHRQGFESDSGLRGFEDEATYDTARLATLRQARLRDREVARRQQAEIARTVSMLHDNLAEVGGNLRALTLRAPVAGRLTDFSLQPGQTLKQGDQIGEIDSIDAFRLDADIDEFYLGRVAEGQAGTADLDGTIAELTLSRVKPQVKAGQFSVELTFDHAPPPGLRRGENIDCRLTLGRTQTALVLPNGPWLESGGGSSAFVLDASGRHAVRRPISVGRRNPEQVEILSGLAAGERVITSSTAQDQTYARLLIR
ncbi:efflux RND transporter periplasmic adaptor subunit [Lichenicoccus sp.]|uniref:efflux RND transporter periplasmic adaptor subunit n=1 Tax=Lichenicoccus sp. TaxID=2781899 RepID=UPI003D1514A4